MATQKQQMSIFLSPRVKTWEEDNIDEGGDDDGEDEDEDDEDRKITR